MMTQFLHFFKTEKNKFEGRILYPGTECDFLIFLLNTSNFHWRKNPDDVTPEDLQIQTRSLISKLCAIGYLMQPIKFRKDHRAVIAINGNIYSSGGNGKSLFCNVLSEIQRALMLSGRNMSLERDPFIWEEINSNTKLVYIDDVSPRFDFQFLFESLSGEMVINQKAKPKYSIPHRLSPKFLLSKEFSPKGTGASFFQRMWLLEFSDYYNDNHSPLDDFKKIFISEWDEKQWSLLNQLLIDCMQLYSQFGMVATSEKEFEIQRYSMN